MDDLISREELGNRLRDMYYDALSIDSLLANGVSLARRIAKEIPAVDAVPRSMLDAAIADIPHICSTCAHNAESCAKLDECAKSGGKCWEWRGIENG